MRVWGDMIIMSITDTVNIGMTYEQQLKVISERLSHNQLLYNPKRATVSRLLHTGEPTHELCRGSETAHKLQENEWERDIKYEAG